MPTVCFLKIRVNKYMCLGVGVGGGGGGGLWHCVCVE